MFVYQLLQRRAQLRTSMGAWYTTFTRLVPQLGPLPQWILTVRYRYFSNFDRYSGNLVLKIEGQGPYSLTSYDISQVSDWSRWSSRPIRSLRYIVTCTRIRSQYLPFSSPFESATVSEGSMPPGHCQPLPCPWRHYVQFIVVNPLVSDIQRRLITTKLAKLWSTILT